MTDKRETASIEQGGHQHPLTIPTLGIHPADGEKALPNSRMISDGLSERPIFVGN